MNESQRHLSDGTASSTPSSSNLVGRWRSAAAEVRDAGVAEAEAPANVLHL
jgi:hypothetical protein